MTRGPYLIGIDVGTTWPRVAIFDIHGKALIEHYELAW